MNSIPSVQSLWGAHWNAVTAAYLICEQWSYIRLSSLMIEAVTAEREGIVLW